METGGIRNRNVALKVNCSQISFDSTQKIIDIQSKCSLNTCIFKRVVGAVTIIFTDNGYDSSESECPATGIPPPSRKIWANIPSTFSILPSPGHGGDSVKGVGYSVQSTNDNINQLSGGTESNTNGQTQNVMGNSEEDRVLIKQEPMSPGAEETTYGTIPCFTAGISAGAPSFNLNQSNGNFNALESQMQSQMGEIHFSDNKIQGKFSTTKCKVCFRNIQNRKEFTCHAKAHKNVFGSKECCPVCLKTFEKRMNMIRHSFVHFSNTLYCCPICQIKIARMDSFRRHFHKRHPASLPQLRWYLANHRKDAQNTFHGSSFKRQPLSSNLNSTYKTSLVRELPAQNMRVDIDAEGIQRVNIVTQPAGRSFEVDSSEEQSVGQILSNSGGIGADKSKKTSKCSFCWSKMSNLEEFVSHMEAHKAVMKVPNTCPVCLHEFSDKMRVKRHASKHVQTAMYVCPICLIQVPRADSFRRHIKKVHRHNTDDIKVLVKYSMSASGFTERVPETFSESLNTSASSDGFMNQPMSSDDMKIKQEVTSGDYSGSSEVTVKQEMPSEDSSASEYVPYSIFNKNGESVWFNTAKHSSSTATSTHENSSHDLGSTTPEKSPAQNSNMHSAEAIESLSTGEQSQPNDTPVNSDSNFLQQNMNVVGAESRNDSVLFGTENIQSPLTTFNAPKRGGYRHSKSPAVSDADMSPSGKAGKKKLKKEVNSVCFFCSAILMNTQQFMEHAVLHAEEGKNTCPVCVTDYARKLGLMRHSVNHVPSDAHTCNVCGTSFGRRDVMLRHYRKVHKIYPDYQRQEASPRPDSSLMSVIPETDDLQILSFDSITAPSIPPLPGDGDSHISAVGAVNMVDDEDMMYSCGLCGAQYHDAKTLQEHVLNHPHDI